MPAQIADLTTRAVSSRITSGLTLAAFTRDVRWALGETKASSRRIPWVAVGAVLLLVAAASGAWVVTRRAVVAEASETPGHDAPVLDAATEAAQALALVDEHTAAIQVYREIGRVLVRHVPAAHPALAWNDVHEAWVRTLAGDRLTTEQLLEPKPSWLAAELGDRHPYVRTVRLALAATLEARGRMAEGAALRQLADRSTRSLFPSSWDLAGLDDDPVPPGVIAHMAPQSPEREGFRQDRPGRFVTPLTTTQRIAAMTFGWKMWIVAAGSCRVSMTTGADPRRVEIDVTRTAGGEWRGSVKGVAPVVEFAGQPGDTPAVAMSMTPAQSLDLAFGERRERRSGTLDTAPEPVVPPYLFGFEESSGGCALVWLEIPFPVEARFQAARQSP